MSNHYISVLSNLSQIPLRVFGREDNRFIIHSIFDFLFFMLSDSEQERLVSSCLVEILCTIVN